MRRGRAWGVALWGLALLTVGAPWTASAEAAGLVVGADDLPRKERVALTRAVAEARRSDPDAFAAVARVRAELSNQRAARPAAARSLRRLGAAALYPMLEALALDASPLGAASDEERRVLAVGMIEALGSLRDARAAAVIRAAFAHAAAAELSRAAAEALGRRCDARALALLVDGLGDVRRGAAIDGLGQCRRAEAARVLAAQLDAAGDGDEASRLALSLGRLASSWAWKALGPSRAQEGLALRRLASAALVRGYLRHPEKARAAERVALIMAAHPDLQAIVRQVAAGADERTRRRLEAMAQAVSPR